MPYDSDIIVIGCGNILFKDDGYGPIVINLLQKYFNDKNDYYDPALTSYVEDEFDKDVLNQIKEKFEGVTLPNGVQFIDGGTAAPMNFFPLYKEYDWKKLIVIDVVESSAEPGTVGIFDPNAMQVGKYDNPHGMTVEEPLQKISEKCEVVIVGCKPASIPIPDIDVGLSESVEKAIPEAIDIILKEIGGKIMFGKLKKAFGGSAEPAPKVEEKVEEVAPVETKTPAEEPKAASSKPRIGYIHLSGCTGDAMSLTENYDILSTVLTDMVDIVYGQTLVDKWIHGTYAEEMPEMDLCLIEGSVCLQDEHSVHELLEARKKAGLIAAFGSCAITGCFTTYSRGGQQAQPNHESFLPIGSLVKVDVALPGCPVAPEMIAKTIVALCEGDLDYLKPAMDWAACDKGCGCDVLTNVVRQGLCTGCGTCALACPTRAMGFSEGRPSCGKDRCIKCGSCYMMCPRSWLPEGRIKKETGL